MTKPKSKKQKTFDTKNGFDLYSSQFFLTYSRCSLTKNQVLEEIKKIIKPKKIDKKYYICNYIIALEYHEDGYPHIYVYLKLDKKLCTRKETFFDIKIDDIIYHPNIQGVRSPKQVEDYILKNRDYISKYKIDNLKIAQKVIERKIKEGIYITSSMIAKEYPKTFVIYGKRLLDWKIKIEEEYYKPPGQEILIIDEFTESQLYFSTLLKILSGQQRRFDIKEAKEINRVKHMIITSNKKLNDIYKSFEYNEEQFDWQINAIWHYKKLDTGFSERKCEKNPYLKQLHRKYLKQIKYHNFFEENWDIINNESVSKNIFHNQYSKLQYDILFQGGELNDDDLPTEEI
ncbi:19247_t:CDS:2, partial [Cetraspora pellucida]